MSLTAQSSKRYGPGLAYIHAVTSAMERNQLLAGTVEKNLPSFVGKILPASSAQWPSLGGPRYNKQRRNHSRQTGISAGEGAAGFTTREPITNHKLRAERAHRNIGSQL